MSDRSGKTEQPTQRRLEKARREGQFPVTREFVSALQFMVFLLLLGAAGGGWCRAFQESMRGLFRMAFTTELNVENLTDITRRIGRQQFLPLAIGGLAVVA